MIRAHWVFLLAGLSASACTPLTVLFDRDASSTDADVIATDAPDALDVGSPDAHDATADLAVDTNPDVTDAPDVPPTCGPDENVCNGVCASIYSTSHCGPDCRLCPTISNASATCDGTACGLSCNPGFTLTGGSLCQPSTLPTTDLVVTHPSLGSIVTSRFPTIRWNSKSGTTDAVTDLCLDPGCNAIVAHGEGMASFRPGQRLPVGRIYVRIRSSISGQTSVATTTSWFMVPRSNIPAGGPESSWGQVPDFDNDGFSDIAAGDPSADPIGATPRSGEVEVFRGSSTGVDTTPLTIAARVTGGRFGTSVATVGDVNGDGFTDLAVGSPTYRTNAGRVDIYLGQNGRSPVASLPWATLYNPNVEQFGWSVAAAGDVNGDGLADVIIGSNPISLAPGAYVYFGNPDAMAFETVSPAELVNPGATSDSQFGIAVAGACDLDGDGRSEVFVGDPMANTGYGNVYVYANVDVGRMVPVQATLRTESMSHLGGAVACAGDVDGNGFPDVIAGSASQSAGTSAVAVVAYDPLGDVTRFDLVAGDVRSEFGAEVAGIGDVNDDGLSDLVVGEPGASNGGNAYLFLGGNSFHLTSDAARVWSNGLVGSRYGGAVASPSDITGDGIMDVVVSGNEIDREGAAGRIDVYFGNRQSPLLAPAVKIDTLTNTSLGAALALLDDADRVCLRPRAWPTRWR